MAFKRSVVCFRLSHYGSSGYRFFDFFLYKTSLSPQQWVSPCCSRQKDFGLPDSAAFIIPTIVRFELLHAKPHAPGCNSTLDT
jgi:hypothetical protein